jgi:hypothetical protein
MVVASGDEVSPACPRGRHNDEVPEEFLEHMVVCSGHCTAAGEPLLRLLQVKNKGPAVVPQLPKNQEACCGRREKKENELA